MCFGIKCFCLFSLSPGTSISPLDGQMTQVERMWIFFQELIWIYDHERCIRLMLEQTPTLQWMNTISTFFFLCPTVNSDNLAGDLRCGESGNQAPSIPGLWSPCRIPCCLLTAEKSKTKSEASWGRMACFRFAHLSIANKCTCAHLIASDAERNSLIVWLGIHRRGGGTRELVPMVHLPFDVEKKPAGKWNQNIAKQDKS